MSSVVSGATRKFWKESASLIIIGKNALNIKNSNNYKVLVLKRSKDASHMPNGVVFPGGLIERIDSVGEWKAFYNSLGISNEKLKEVSLINGTRPAILQKPADEELDRNISLRITAVRETFEEMGILICKTKEQFQQKNNMFSEIYQDFDAKYWQEEVHKDASKFLILCKKLNVAPDLWSSYEWASWLTPAHMVKRFNVVFYMVALKTQPKILAEDIEVQDFMWETPEMLVNLHNNKTIWLPPPQLYELSKLLSINDADKLIEFAKLRNSNGISLHFPVFYKTTNAFVSVFPEDDLYPKNIDPTKTGKIDEKYSDKSKGELREMAKNLHRIEFSNQYDYDFFMNVKPLYGHLIPIKPNGPSKL